VGIDLLGMLSHSLFDILASYRGYRGSVAMALRLIIKDGLIDKWVPSHTLKIKKHVGL